MLMVMMSMCLIVVMVDENWENEEKLDEVDLLVIEGGDCRMV